MQHHKKSANAHLLHPFQSSLLLGQHSLQHGFFSRQGGVSQELLASLNTRDLPPEQKNKIRNYHYFCQFYKFNNLFHLYDIFRCVIDSILIFRNKNIRNYPNCLIFNLMINCCFYSISGFFFLNWRGRMLYLSIVEKFRNAWDNDVNKFNYYLRWNIIIAGSMFLTVVCSVSRVFLTL